MIKTIWLNHEDMPRWDEFVRNHPLGWICHLSAWKSVLEKSFPHIKGHFLALQDEKSNNILAGLPIYTVKSRLTGNRLVCAPFSAIFDPLITSCEDMDIIFPKLFELYNKTKASYIEVRTSFPNLLNQNKNFESLMSYKHHFIKLDRPPEEIKKTFHRTAVRQVISKSTKIPLKLKIGNSETDLSDFYRLYFLTRRRIGLPPIPYIFFKSLWENFGRSKHFRLLIAVYKTQPVAGLILFKYNNTVSLEIVGDNENYKKLYPVHFLYWESIKLACEEGYKILSFGRTAKNNEGLIAFKERWGTDSDDLKDFYYPKSFCEKHTEKDSSFRYKLIKKSSEIAPDFIFRMIGNFCYRHMG